MRRQLMCVFLTAAVLTGVVNQAQAAEQTGSISVTVDYGDDQVHDVSVLLYKVGNRSGSDYVLTDVFGGGLVNSRDIQSPALAKWLAEIAEGKHSPRILDADGNAFFSHLTEGLYLLVQNETEAGLTPAEPFLVPMPCYGQWEVTALPKVRKILTESPQTGQHPAPIIGAMGLVLSGLALMICAEKFRKK